MRFICTSLLISGVLNLNAGATSGSCGAGATWSYDADEGTLTIAGTGAMADYTDALTDVPWNDYRTQIAQVVVGDGITHIGNWAFMGLTNMTSVTIGKRVESIGHEAFSNCTNAGFTKLNIPGSVKTIGMFAFSNNHLKYVCMGSGITSIGREAFCLCQDLEYVGIYALTPPAYGMDAFSAVPNLKAIYVDDYCRSGYANADGWSTFADIIQRPFGYCGDSDGAEPGENVYWGYDMMTCKLTISGTGAMKDYSAMGGPTAYPWNNPAFNPMGGEYNMYWTGIEKIEMSKNITNVPDWAFAMQINCTSVTLPSALTSIGSSALEECAFTSITLPEGLTTIGDYAFYGSKLTSLLIPSTVSTIGADAFLDNNDLAYVTCAGSAPIALINGTFGDGSALAAIFVPENTTDAYKGADGWSAYADKIQAVPTTTFTYTAAEKVAKFDNYEDFNGAIGIKSHEFADGTGTVVYTGYVTALGERALSYAKMTGITIPESITSLGSGAFMSSTLESVTFAGTASLKTIGPRAFSSCSSLTAFIVPESVETIGDSSFSGCKNLATFTFAGTPAVTSIGNAAFQDCKKLTAFTIPVSVTTLGRTVFWFTGLTSLTIPAGVTQIGQALFCSSPITSLTVDAGNANYADLGCNGIFEKATGKLVAGGAITTVPDGIKTIGQEAFWGEEGTFSLSLPESVTTIENRAFHMARGLTSLSIPSGITYIDEECFQFCEGMQDIYCYASPTMTWDGGMELPVFIMMTPKATQFHVAAADLDAWTTNFADANVSFVGDLLTSKETITIGAAGMATYCSSYALDFSGSDVVAYIATAFDGSTVTLTPITEVPSHTGIIIVGNAGNYDIQKGAGGIADGNLLVGTTIAKQLSQVQGDNTIFILGNDGTHGIGFYKVADNSTIAGHKAYLPLPTASLGAASSISLRFDDGTTNVRSMENGQWRMENEAGEWFTVDGRRVEASRIAPGLYILRGKKVIVK